MNWKFTAIFLLAGLSACAHNSDNISSTRSSPSSAIDSSGSAGASSTGGGGSYGGGASGYSGTGGGYGSPAGAQASCDAQPVQNLIGKTLDDATTAQARQGSNSAKVRVLKPGQVMTMEYDPTRINLITDKNNALTALRCG